jgi:hypothetical protein
LAAAGKNGPVIVPFTKDGDTYKAPAGAKLNADQLKRIQEWRAVCQRAQRGQSGW